MDQMPQDIIELKINAPAILTEARHLATQIKTNSDIELAYAWCNQRKAEVDLVVARLATGKKAAAAAHEEWCKLERDATKTRLDGINIVKASIGQTTLELQRKQKIEDDRKLAIAAKEDEERRLREAEKLERQGNPTMADAVLAGAGNFIPPQIQQPKISGGNVRKVWTFEVTNMREFISYIHSRGNLEGEDNALLPNKEWLDAKAKMSDGNAKVPGVRFYEKAQVSLRRSA